MTKNLLKTRAAALLVALAAIAPTAAHADPIISPIILSLLATAGINAGATLIAVGTYTLSVGAFATALVTTSIGVGLHGGRRR